MKTLALNMLDDVVNSSDCKGERFSIRREERDIELPSALRPPTRVRTGALPL